MYNTVIKDTHRSFAVDDMNLFTDYEKMKSLIGKHNTIATRSFATAKSTARPSCLIDVLYDILSGEVSNKLWPIIGQIFASSKRVKSAKDVPFGVSSKKIHPLPTSPQIPKILHYTSRISLKTCINRGGLLHAKIVYVP